MGCVASNAAVETVERVPAARAKAAREKDFHSKYALQEKLGQGACAVVYAATHTDCSNKQLAVKVVDLRDSLSKHLDFDDKTIRLDQRRLRSIKNEAALLSAVSGHDNICRMFGHFIHGGLAYIVFERYDRTLPEAVASCAAITEETLRPFFREMLTGISALHIRRIVHRDVKPDNFMCSGLDNTVKLCDFGIACALAPSDELENTECTGVCGTAPYIAPEVLEQKEYGVQVDVWSFGVVVHVLLCGCWPYMPLEKTSSSMKAAILKGFPTSKLLNASEHQCTSVNMSEEAKSLIIALLSRNASERPTCHEALEDKFFTSRSLYHVCLRREFEAAGRCRAFDDTTIGKAAIGEVDLRLRQLQNRQCGFATTQCRSPSSEISTDIGSSSGESGQSSESPAHR